MHPLPRFAWPLAVVTGLAGATIALAWQRAPLPAAHGRVTAMALAPSQPQRVFVGLRGLGVWRSDDRGTTWTDCSGDLPGDTVVLALEVSPGDPDLVWAGVAERAAGPLFRSTDGGGSWTVASAGLGGASVRDLEIPPAPSGVLRAAVAGGSEPGVYESTDDGLSWVRLGAATLGEDAFAVAADPGDPDVIVAGTQTGWARTTDGGASWTTTDTTFGFRNLSWSAVNADRLYATRVPPYFDTQVRRSTDHGATFEALFSLSYAAPRPIAAHPTDGATMYIGGHESAFGFEEGWVWRTTDDGASFTKILSVDDDVVTGILIDPDDPQNLYVGEEALDGRGFRRTSDGGGTWTLAIDGLFNYDVGTLCESASGRMYALWNARMYAARGGTAPCCDVGTDWEHLGQFVIGAPQEGHVDGQTTGATDVLFRWGSYGGGDFIGYYFAMTPNGGANWISQSGPSGIPSDEPVHEVAVDRPTGRHVYVSLEWSGLYRSDEGGQPDAEYALVNPLLGGTELAVHPVDPFTLFVAGGPLTVEVAFDGGETTTARNAGLPSEGGGLEIVDLFLSPSDPDRLAVVYSDGSVYGTRNGGLSWEMRFGYELGGGTVERASWDPVSGHVFLVSSGGGGLLTSHPGVPAGLPTGLLETVHYSPSLHTLFVGTRYAGLWHAFLPPPVGVAYPGAVDGVGLRVHPNPFRSAARIELDMPPGGAEVRVAVYDTAGRLIRELTCGRRRAGAGAMVWDGRDAGGRAVTSGVYFLRATVEGRDASRKIVLRR